MVCHVLQFVPCHITWVGNTIIFPHGVSYFFFQFSVLLLVYNFLCLLAFCNQHNYNVFFTTLIFFTLRTYETYPSILSYPHPSCLTYLFLQLFLWLHSLLCNSMRHLFIIAPIIVVSCPIMQLCLRIMNVQPPIMWIHRCLIPLIFSCGQWTMFLHTIMASSSSRE